MDGNFATRKFPRRHSRRSSGRRSKARVYESILSTSDTNSELLGSRSKDSKLKDNTSWKAAEESSSNIKATAQASNFAVDSVQSHELLSSQLSNLTQMSDGSEMMLEYDSALNDWQLYPDQNSELFDPNDEKAIILKTESGILKLSRLPYLPPAEPTGSYQRIIKLESLSDYSYSSDDSEVLPGQPDTVVEKPLPEAQEIHDDEGPSGEPYLLYPTRLPIKMRAKAVPKIAEGRFVNPLTGSDITVEVRELTPESFLSDRGSVSMEGTAFEGEELEEEFSFPDFDAIYPEDESSNVTLAANKETEEDLLDILMNQNVKEGKLVFQLAQETKMKEEHECSKKQIRQYLEDLIDHIVSNLKDDEELIFKSKLDKILLFRTLRRDFDKMQAENWVASFLRRKTLEFYHRKGLYRCLIPEPAGQVAAEKIRYETTLESLNKLLKLEASMKEVIAAKSEKLSNDANTLEQKRSDAIAMVHNFFRNAFDREGMPHLQELLEREITRMMNLRKEISAVRFDFIYRQHTLANLQARLNKMHYIGSGLRLIDYENVSREVEALRKKNEERNKDLKRFHNRFHTTLHTISHTKWRSTIVSNRIVAQTLKLRSVEGEVDTCRSRVYKLKVFRRKLYRLRKDLSYNCGLLERRSMMLEFDETLESLHKKRKLVEELRATKRNLDERLINLEKLLNAS